MQSEGSGCRASDIPWLVPEALLGRLLLAYEVFHTSLEPREFLGRISLAHEVIGDGARNASLVARGHGLDAQRDLNHKHKQAE